MSNPAKNKNGNPSGSQLPAKPASPADSLNTLVEITQSLLRGEVPTVPGWRRMYPETIELIKAFGAATPPAMTIEDLATIYHDRENPEADNDDGYHDRCPVGRALAEGITDLLDADFSNETKSPLCAHYMLMAHRKNFEHLLSLAGVEVQA